MNWHDIDCSALYPHKGREMTRTAITAAYYYPDEVGIG